jgi:hypothetical protein
MASLNLISTPLIATVWNGVDAHTFTQPVTVTADASHLVLRLTGGFDEPDSITYNSVPVPKIEYINDTNSQGGGIYILAAPADGLHDLVINTAGTARTYQFIIADAMDCIGVGTPMSSGGYAGNRSLALTTAIGDLVVDVLAAPNDLTIASGPGQSDQLINTNGASASSEIATGVTTTMSWTNAADFSVQVAVVLVAGAAGTSVSPPDPLTDGATAQAYNPSGFTSGNITAVTLDGVNVPAFTQTTFDNFDVAGVTVDGTAGPKFGSVVFEATNGTETANDTIVNQPAADHDYVEMATIDTVSPGTLYQLMLAQLGKTLAPPDQFYWNDLDTSIINDDSSFAIVVPKTFWWYEASSGEWWTLTLSAGGGLTATAGKTRNGLIGQIIEANNGTITDPNNRNQLLKDWLDSLS